MLLLLLSHYSRVRSASIIESVSVFLHASLGFYLTSHCASDLPAYLS